MSAIRTYFPDQEVFILNLQSTGRDTEGSSPSARDKIGPSLGVKPKIGKKPKLVFSPTLHRRVVKGGKADLLVRSPNASVEAIKNQADEKENSPNGVSPQRHGMLRCRLLLL